MSDMRNAAAPDSMVRKFMADFKEMISRDEAKAGERLLSPATKRTSGPYSKKQRLHRDVRRRY
jgi:hypothetical protein